MQLDASYSRLRAVRRAADMGAMVESPTNPGAFFWAAVHVGCGAQYYSWNLCVSYFKGPPTPPLVLTHQASEPTPTPPPLAYRLTQSPP